MMAKMAMGKQIGYGVVGEDVVAETTSVAAAVRAGARMGLLLRTYRLCTRRMCP